MSEYSTIPLAERMRPKSLDTYFGQEHLTAEGNVIHNLLQQKNIQSMIFWGPPGVGKTTLAQIIASTSDMPLISLSAIESGIKDVREAIELSKRSRKAILFIDEIHRFNKTQQDSLLGAVEKGYIILIGATTENPSFEVINALLSRCQVFTLQELSVDALKNIVNHALRDDVILSKRKIIISDWEALIRLSGGDGRKILNILELVTNTRTDEELKITNSLVLTVVQNNLALYDKNGEQHYDLISAFIKSIRGSDPNAAVYYLARMIEGGEDPKFIARRLIILASEDIGNANPNALLLANNCFQAVSVIGYPECRIILSQTVTYLASSPKSNAAYMAINYAQELVKKTGNVSVPLGLRNAPTKLMKEMDYGLGYKYAHDYQNSFVDFEFMPESLKGIKLYDPKNIGNEAKLKEYLRLCWKDKYGY